MNCPTSSITLSSMGKTGTGDMAMAQMGFLDLPDRYASLDLKKDALVEINAVVPWEEFRPVLMGFGAGLMRRAGRGPKDAVLMFKVLVLFDCVFRGQDLARLRTGAGGLSRRRHRGLKTNAMPLRGTGTGPR